MNAIPEIEVTGHVYRIGRLPALTQFHVARRLAPVLASLGSAVSALAGSSAESSQEQWLLSAFAPVSEAVAKMPEDDANYVIHACLAVVTRQDDARWALIQKGNSLMYQDIDLPVILRLVVEVVKENLGGFFKQVAGGSA